MFITAVLWTAYFVVAFNLAMMIPLLPFIQHRFDLSPSETGMLLAAFPVVALVSNLALGPIIDKYGRKRFIVAGSLGCSVILALTALASNSSWIMVGRAATGLFMPMIGASVFAAIADYVPESNRARVAGYVTSAAPIAFLCSLSVGIILGGFFSWQLPIICLAAICCVLACLASTLPSTNATSLSQMCISRKTYRDRLVSLSSGTKTRPLLASYFCWSVGVYTFLGLYPSWLVQNGLAGMSLETIGAVVFFGEIGGLVGALFCGWLSSWFKNPLTLCIVSSVGIAFILLIIPLGHGSPAIQTIAYTIFAFGRDLMLALILGDAMRMVAASHRGSLNAALNAAYQTGGTLGGLASAWLYSFRADFSANTVVASMVFLTSAFLLHSISKEKMAEARI
ncbi:MFS transporter [Pseudomonas sp. RL_5y_Pfl2_73]|uniref:MFS transporter n=1 Tax=Pseudomonas sp. RL_5y_Pfl2_73 TaxID=3088713 RepID=UPI0030D935E1